MIDEKDISLHHHATEDPFDFDKEIEKLRKARAKHQSQL